MEEVVLDNVKFEIVLPELLKHLHIAEGDGDAARVAEMVDEARVIGRPKSACKIGYIEDRDEQSVVIDGVSFKSRVLRVNLDQSHRVFAYLATCGMELHEWACSFPDMMEQYWADMIKATALQASYQAVHEYITQTYRPGQTSRMNPGSLADWPIEQQRPLFELLGEIPEAIGVQLTDSFLMVPNKSVSGIRFPTETSFENCQLCPREICPGRRAPYDKDLYAQKYATVQEIIKN